MKRLLVIDGEPVMDIKLIGLPDLPDGAEWYRYVRDETPVQLDMRTQYVAERIVLDHEAKVARIEGYAADLTPEMLVRRGMVKAGGMAGAQAGLLTRNEFRASRGEPPLTLDEYLAELGQS